MRFFHILLFPLCFASVFINGKDAPPQSIQADAIGYDEDVSQQHRHLSLDTEVPSLRPTEYEQTCDNVDNHDNPCCVGGWACDTDYEITVYPGACDGNYACMSAGPGTIGRNSCVADFACQGAGNGSAGDGPSLSVG